MQQDRCALQDSRTGASADVKFDVKGLHKPIVASSSVVKKGTSVQFSPEGSCIIPIIQTKNISTHVRNVGTDIVADAGIEEGLLLVAEEHKHFVHVGAQRTVCFQWHATHRFQICLLLPFSQYDDVLSRRTRMEAGVLWCVERYVTVVSRPFWFVIHFTDTNGTVYCL